MAKKLLFFLLLMLLTSLDAMADYQKYEPESGECWVDDNGIIYKVVDDIMYLYSYNQPATDLQEATVPGAPTWDYDKEYDLEILDYFEAEGYTVTQVYRQAFNGVTNIKTLKIPNTIEKIGASAFANCTGLETITCYATTPPDLSAGSCFGMATSTSNGYYATVYVPYGCKEAYLNDDPTNESYRGWGYYAAQGYFTYEELAEGETGTVTQGILTVTPETNSRLKGVLESITISYDGGVALNAESLSIDILDSDGAVAAILKPATSANSDGSYTLYVYDATGTAQTPLSTYGDYTLTIPGGSFTLGEDKSIENVKTTLNYTVEDDNQYTIILDPENGYKSSSTISSFTVSCEDGIEQLIGLDFNYLYVYNDGSSDPITNITKNGAVSDSETTINFVFDSSISKPGTYRFTFPEGSFRVGPYNQLSDAIEVTYTILGDVVEEEGEWTINPEESTAVSSLEEIQIQYSTGLEIAEGKEDQIVLTGSNGNTYTSNDFTIETITNGIIITLSEEITEAGTYTLSAPAGTFLLGQTKKESDDFSASFIVVSYALNFNPEDGSTLEIIDTFTITCEDGLEAVLNDQNEMADLNIISNGEIVALGVPDQGNPTFDEDGNIIGYTYTVEVKVYDEDTESYSYEISPITDSGTYTIELGRGYFLLGEEKIINDICSCIYTIEEKQSSSIHDITTTKEIQDNNYYNLSGQRVSAIRKSGVYIINRKKIIAK